MISATDRPPPNNRRSRAGRYIAAVEDGLLAVLVAALIGLAATQILLRNVWDSGIAWGDPLLRILVLWVGLIGAMVATRENNQITIDVLSRYLPARTNTVCRLITDLFTVVVCTVLAWHGGRFVYMDWQDSTIAFAGVPAWLCEAIIPIGFTVIAVRYLLSFASRLRSLTRGGP